MANAKISQLPAVTSATGSDLGVVVQGGVTSNVTVDNLFKNRTLVAPVLGTPASGTLTNCTIPVGGVTGLGTGVATALAQNVNGTGAISLTTSPTFVTPTLGVATATTINVSNIKANDGTAAATIADSTGAVAFSTAVSTTSTISGAVTSGSATPGTSRAIIGSYTTHTSMTGGNLVGVRGVININGNMSGATYLYGTQGKIIAGAHTVDVGSAYVAGLFGQYDATGTTITSGYNCGVASDIFGVSSGTKAIDMFYGQNADGGTINSYLRAYGKTTTVFEFDTNSGSQAATAGELETVGGYLKVVLNGETRYIQLYEAIKP